MFGQTFYHKTLRKYVTYFGTLFNDLYINRTDGGGKNVQSLRIPITYAPRDKALARVDSDPGLDRPAAVILPIMSFEMTGLKYAASRKLATITKSKISKINTANDNYLSYAYNPVPYDIDFTLNIMVKNAEDGTRILEQILPFFTPEWTATLNIIPELDIKLDIPVLIKDISHNDTYDSNFDERRVLTWTINFTMLGYLFGPVKKFSVITLANTNFYESLTANTVAENITITPGLLANGSPTTNAQLTIDRFSIKANDDWGYIINKTSIDET
jgi:hypothetical protein